MANGSVLWIKAVISTIAAVTANAVAQQAGGSLNLRVTVLVYNYAKAEGKQLELAQRVAGQIYKNAGIEIQWQQNPTTIKKIENSSARRGASAPPRLVLRIKPAPPARLIRNNGVCGEALLSEDKELARFADIADIYFERVEKQTWELWGSSEAIFSSYISPGMCTGLILGVVIAHELGHLMLGTNSHSGHGIMRPAWSRQDLHDAYVGSQAFTPEQAQRLQVNLLARSQAAMQTQLAGSMTP